MTTGEKVLFTCKYEHCENPPRYMKPSAAAYQDFCSKSCASKHMWQGRVKAIQKESKKRETCLVGTCNKEPKRDGFCKPHHTRWSRSGDPLVLKRMDKSCPLGCTCGRHNAKPGVRVPSAPCLACGTVKMVHLCYGPDGNEARKFCDQECWRKWQKDQASVRRAAGETKAWDMSPSEFQERLTAQDNKCAICLKQITGRDIHRDHDHTTGEWRGLLCNNCNRGLGHFQDDSELLIAAAFYLAKEVDVLGNLSAQ